REGGDPATRPAPRGVGGLVAAEADPATGRWYALTEGGTAMAVFDTAPDATTEPSTVVPLDAIGGGRFRAIAPNPADGLVYLLGDQLYGIDEAGSLHRTVDLDGVELAEPADMVFAPSADTTDAADEQSLYLVDRADVPGSTRLVEATLAPLVVTVDTSSTLVATRDLSALTPPSPDPAGIAYLPGEDRLVVSDSEV